MGPHFLDMVSEGFLTNFEALLQNTRKKKKKKPSFAKLHLQTIDLFAVPFFCLIKSEHFGEEKYMLLKL